MIDDNGPTRRRPERAAGNVDVCFLMREQRLQPEAIPQVDVDGPSDDGRAVEIDGPVRRELKEVAAEAVSDERDRLDGLCRDRSKQADGQDDGKRRER